MPAFLAVVPARYASTRFPGKPLVDIAGKPMVVRVAERAALSGAQRVVVATDDARIAQACSAHGVECITTRADHPTGTDRIAEAARLLGLPDEAIVVNVQGDEPLVAPGLVSAVAAALQHSALASVATACHPISSREEVFNPNVVKVVLDGAGHALYFSRAPIPWWRDGQQDGGFKALPAPAPLRHIGIYSYRAGFLRQFPQLPPAPVEALESLEQLRALWHGHRIAVHVTDAAPGPGVDTPADLERVRGIFATPAA